MMRRAMKRVIESMGYSIRKRRRDGHPGGSGRPIDDMRLFLEDLSARGFRPRGVLDVGANEGQWSEMAHAIFPDAVFVLVEPQTEMESRLKAFCGRFPNASFVNACAGPVAGELVLTVWPDRAGSTVLADQAFAHAHGMEQRRVPVVTLDSLYPEGSPLPDLVKLDIQGFELEALKGASKLFGATTVFILETSLFKFLPTTPVLSEVVRFMDERGYAVYDICGYLRRPLDGALGQLDVAFVRHDAGLRGSSGWDQ